MKIPKLERENACGRPPARGPRGAKEEVKSAEEARKRVYHVFGQSVRVKRWSLNKDWSVTIQSQTVVGRMAQVLLWILCGATIGLALADRWDYACAVLLVMCGIAMIAVWRKSS